MRSLSKAFTLIELLIVVAIIAILAAIAVPNFLEAQTRSKVSRTRADMRSIATAIEAYRVDTNRYPPDRYDHVDPNNPAWPSNDWNDVLNRVTTPVAYMTSLPIDVFVQQNPDYGKFTWYITQTGYGSHRHYPPNAAGFFYGPRANYAWALVSPAPDLYWEFDRDPASVYPQAHGYPWVGDVLYYDPTNGTVSQGDIYTYGPGNAVNPAPVPPIVP